MAYRIKVGECTCWARIEPARIRLSQQARDAPRLASIGRNCTFEVRMCFDKSIARRMQSQLRRRRTPCYWQGRGRSDGRYRRGATAVREDVRLKQVQRMPDAGELCSWVYPRLTRVAM